MSLHIGSARWDRQIPWVFILLMLFSMHKGTSWVNWLAANSLKHRFMIAFMVVYALPSAYSAALWRENWIAHYVPKANAFKWLPLPTYVQLPTYISLIGPEQDFPWVWIERPRSSLVPRWLTTLVAAYHTDPHWWSSFGCLVWDVDGWKET